MQVSLAAGSRPSDWQDDPVVPEGSAPRVFYHFTSLEAWLLIASHGILKGDVPLTMTGGFNVPWLTDDPERRGQRWVAGSVLNKAAVRLTVQVPFPHPLLIHWPELARQMKVDPKWFAALDRASGGGSEHWWVFKGRIPPAWIIKVEATPLVGGSGSSLR